MPRVTAAIVTVLCSAIALLAAYDVRRVNDEIPELRDALTGGVSLSTESLRDAAGDLEAISSTLDRISFSVLRIVPIARENIDAARQVARAARPVVETMLDVHRRLGSETDPLFVDGTAQLDRIEDLLPLVARQRRAFAELEASARASLNGSLLPSIWSDVAEVARRARELEEAARVLERTLTHLPGMLGGEGERRYAVVLLNNAELRAAGGIVSAIGTIAFSDGQLDVDRFHYYRDLADPRPYRTVPAPADLERRFGRYWADTTLWVNATASPDVPEVAQVIAELVDLTIGEKVSGVVFVDPQGLAAFLDPDDDIDSDVSGIEINARELPEFVYSEAYEVFTSDESRRAALLALAPAVLDEAREEMSVSTLRRLGAAAASGHLRLVSLDPAEQALLEEAGVTGELTTDAIDSVLFTLQNLGADKLDYWIDRRQQHSCEVSTGSARCRGTVRLTNEAPEGLPAYVTHDDPDATYEGYGELYLDEDARLTSFGLDGRSVDAVVESEDGRQAIGVDLEIPRGGSVTIGYSYEIALRDGYTLEIAPQPATEPATLELALRLPVGWTVVDEGQGSSTLIERRRLERPMELRAGPAGALGLSRFWNSFLAFWNEPLL